MGGRMDRTRARIVTVTGGGGQWAKGTSCEIPGRPIPSCERDLLADARPIATEAYRESLEAWWWVSNFDEVRARVSQECEP